MRKIDELVSANGCLYKARPNEMLFVLLGRDAAAPVAIMKWVEERIRLGKNTIDDEQIKEAVQCADYMENERTGLWLPPLHIWHEDGSPPTKALAKTVAR